VWGLTGRTLIFCQECDAVIDHVVSEDPARMPQKCNRADAVRARVLARRTLQRRLWRMGGPRQPAGAFLALPSTCPPPAVAAVSLKKVAVRTFERPFSVER
jgi:hypothetical protein